MEYIYIYIYIFSTYIYIHIYIYSSPLRGSEVRKALRGMPPTLDLLGVVRVAEECMLWDFGGA